MEWLVALEASIGEVVAFVAGGLAIVCIVLAAIYKPFRWMKPKKPEKVEIANPEALAALIQTPAAPAEPIVTLTLDQFDAILVAREARVRARLEHADAKDRAVLQSQLDELTRQKADIDQSLEAERARIADLEARLTLEGNDLDADKLDAARAALETGDYSAADDLFAEIEARAAIAVQSAARAAFARGQIAEAEVRWADAATHYAARRAMNRHWTTCSRRANLPTGPGDYAAALGFGKAALKLTRDGEDQHALGKALNDHAALLEATGRTDAAEPLMREAMQITGAALGKDHPTYATRLNNLAALLEATGRYDEAEPLMREGHADHRGGAGQGPPNLCTRLNNLAALLEATGRYDEAEPLMREAMQITGAALGKDHPDYAANLNNLAALLEATGRYDEAEPLYREAMQITGAALGKDHPDYATRLNNLAVLFAHQGRWADALPMAEKALAIGRRHWAISTRMSKTRASHWQQCGRQPKNEAA